MTQSSLHINGALLTAMMMLLLFGGCAPIPHHEVVSPTVVGMVHRNGVAVENAVIFIDHPLGQSCAATGAPLTHTDAQGNFQLAAQEEFRLFVFMDPGVNWQVCIVDGERRYQGWYQNGIGGAPAEIKLDCNLEKPPSAWEIGSSLTVMGICTSDFQI